MNPTYARTTRFKKDWDDLSDQDKERFRAMIAKFVADAATQTFRPGLRVKKVQGTETVFEVTFAPNGRATWEFGQPIRTGEPHIIWRRVGTHAVLDQP